MCGIYCYCSKHLNDPETRLNPEYSTIKVRGPDNTIAKRLSPQVFAVFHRLSIMDQSSAGNQPMVHPRNDKLWLMCNGEIYNHKKLIEDNQFPVQSKSDCEVILWLYEKYGFEKTVQLIDSESAIVLYDGEKQTLNVSRDPFGVRFLYYGITERSNVIEWENITEGANITERSNITERGNISEKPNIIENYETIGFASFAKGLTKSFSVVQQFPPGHFAIIDLQQSKYTLTFKQYFKLNNNIVNNNIVNDECLYDENLYDENVYLKEIVRSFESAIKKRVKMSHREIGCLLSGGLDSSLVTALVLKYFKKYYPGQRLKTFSIGMKHSTDLGYARKVADYLDTDHREYILTEEEFCNAIPEVVYHLETYDTTTVRASTPNWLLCKKISQDTKCRVLFNGDGSDEVFGGYIYFSRAPSAKAFQNETVERVERIHESDGRRSDHSISSNGIEARTPFLDPQFVRTVMNIPPHLKQHTAQRMEKYLLRKAFENAFIELIPREVLWRRKEAFSDGVSNVERNTQTIIKEYLEKTPEWTMNSEDPQFTYHLPPPNAETKCYRAIFERYFPGHARLVKEFWMPKWCEGVTDPSARALQHYYKET